MGPVKRECAGVGEQARPSSARPAASLFVPQDGEASHHGREPRSCVDSEAIGTCPQGPAARPG